MADIDSQQDATTERRHRGGDRNVFGLVLIGLGVVWFLSETHLLALSAETVLSVLLILLALGLIYTARWGRRMGRWSILLGMGLTFALIANSPSLHFPSVRGGAGNQAYAPVTVADLLPEYQGGFGTFTLDLSAIPTTQLENQVIRVHWRFGSVNVVVKSDVPVEVAGRVRFGHLGACGDSVDNGFSNDRAPYRSPQSASAYLRLTIDTSFGSADVQGCQPVVRSVPPETPVTPPSTPAISVR